jgi:hypothetical protein
MLFAAATLAALLAARPQQETVIPQTALSTCAAVRIVSREDVPAGSHLAVSPDGRWLARLVHTPQGAELFLRDRGPAISNLQFEIFNFERPMAARGSGEDTRGAWRERVSQGQQKNAADRLIALEPPALPPGMAWRVHEMLFSTDGARLVIRSSGALYVVSAADAKLLYRIGFDQEKQSYPGRFALGRDTLAVALWSPESYFAEAAARKPVEIRMLDVTTGKWLRSLLLPLNSSDAWTVLALSPDVTRLAVLQRATRWPGKARLALHDTQSGKALWSHKLGGEDLLFDSDGEILFVLGSELVFLDTASGKQLRKAEPDAGPSEFQRLRIAEVADFAVGHFARYSRLRRALNLSNPGDAMLLLWRLSTGKATCQALLPPALRADAWPTARGEILALEETYELRPPLRLLKSAQIVTYRLAP